jgi:hypothetical protein
MLRESDGRDKEKHAIFDINKPHLITCEGADGAGFLSYLVGAWEVNDSVFSKFQVTNFGGNSELRRYLKTSPSVDGFYALKSITIIRDAEGDCSGAVQSVQSALRNNQYCVPSEPCNPCDPDPDIITGEILQSKLRTGFALFPSCGVSPMNGTLEDLCIEALSISDSDAAMAASDKAVEAVQKNKGMFKRPHKNRLHSYFSLTDKYVTMNIATAAKAGAFSLCNDELENLKSFLITMAA